MDVRRFIKEIMSQSEIKNPKTDIDYYVDGILYCGKCHTRKQVPITVADEVYCPYCLCECKVKERDEQEKIQKLKEAEEAKKQRVEMLKSISMMSSKVQNNTFEKWIGNEKEKSVCEKYCDTFSERMMKNQGLLFYGNSGAGKTFAASCIANCLIEKGYSVLMSSFARLVNVTGTEIYSMIDRMRSADLLIMDDLGAERNSSYAVERVWQIVDSRLLQNKPLIVTTNLTVTEMKNVEDYNYLRIYQRIFEMCYPVPFSGKSYRLDTAKDNFYELKEILG